MLSVLIGLGILLALLNVWATYVLVGSARYSSKQKLAQTCMVWGLPFVGGLLVASLAKDATTHRHTTDLVDRSGNDDGWIRNESSTFEGGADAGGD